MSAVAIPERPAPTITTFGESRNKFKWLSSLLSVSAMILVWEVAMQMRRAAYEFQSTEPRLNTYVRCACLVLTE